MSPNSVIKKGNAELRKTLRETLREGSLANSKLLQQYKESLEKLSQVQWEAAIGLLFGTASLQTQNNGKTFRMKFE
jgi:hypothetical protein